MHLALSRVAQVVRDVPASGKGLAVASAQLLIVAESLAMEAALDCFLQVRMWSTVSAIRTRPASLSWREGEERSKDLTLDQENWSSVKKMGIRESCRKVPRPWAWEQVRKWRDSSTPLQNEHSAEVASLNFCNLSEFESRSLQNLNKVDLWFGERPRRVRLALLCGQLWVGQVSSTGEGRREATPEVGSLKWVTIFSVTLACHCLAERQNICPPRSEKASLTRVNMDSG